MGPIPAVALATFCISNPAFGGSRRNWLVVVLPRMAHLQGMGHQVAGAGGELHRGRKKDSSARSSQRTRPPPRARSLYPQAACRRRTAASPTLPMRAPPPAAARAAGATSGGVPQVAPRALRDPPLYTGHAACPAAVSSRGSSLLRENEGPKSATAGRGACSFSFSRAQKCNRRESNPGRPRGRRASYH